MTWARLAPDLAWPSRRLASRVAAIAGAYLLSAAVSAALVLVVRRWAAPQALRSLLAFVFVSALLAGVDPGGARAQALRPDGAFAPARGAYLAAGALKALLAAPFVALLWRLADRGADPAALASAPLLAAAAFWIADLRVLLDLRGRHAGALGLRLGAVSAGDVAAGVTLLLGGSLALAAALAALLRCAVALAAADRLLEASRPRPRLQAMLGDRRWIELAGASALGAAIGSADRVIGLRWLSPAAFGGYFLVVEALGRLWLIPFLIGPILFARLVARDQGERLMRASLVLVAAASLAMLLAVGASLALEPGAWRSIVGVWAPGGVLVLAVGIALRAFAMLRMTELQARGRATRVLVATALSGVLSVGFCLALAVRWGAGGLMAGVGLGAAIELALVLPDPRRRRAIRAARAAPSRPDRIRPE